MIGFGKQHLVEIISEHLKLGGSYYELVNLVVTSNSLFPKADYISFVLEHFLRRNRTNTELIRFAIAFEIEDPDNTQTIIQHYSLDSNYIPMYKRHVIAWDNAQFRMAMLYSRHSFWFGKDFLRLFLLRTTEAVQVEYILQKACIRTNCIESVFEYVKNSLTRAVCHYLIVEFGDSIIYNDVYFQAIKRCLSQTGHMNLMVSLSLFKDWSAFKEFEYFKQYKECRNFCYNCIRRLNAGDKITFELLSELGDTNYSYFFVSNKYPNYSFQEYVDIAYEDQSEDLMVELFFRAGFFDNVSLDLVHQLYITLLTRKIRSKDVLDIRLLRLEMVPHEQKLAILLSRPIPDSHDYISYQGFNRQELLQIGIVQNCKIVWRNIKQRL
jgi:hypothetical protein